MAEGDTFYYGGVSFPLAIASPNTVLQDADPAIYWALKFYSAIIDRHIGPRLLEEAVACGAPIESAVAYETPMDPVPFLTEEQFKFPLLAVYRKSDKLSRRTYNWSHETTQWGIAYILPPLSAGQAERIAPILSTLPKLLYNRTEKGFDPNVLSGAKVWDSTHAGLEDIDIPEGAFGLFAGTGNQPFMAWTGTIVVNERQMPERGLSPLLRTDYQSDLVNKDETNIDNFVDFQSDVTPPGPPTG